MFMKDWTSFIGKRIEGARSYHCAIPEPQYTGLSKEEEANIKKGMEQECVYLQGLADGLYLARILFPQKQVDKER